MEVNDTCSAGKGWMIAIAKSLLLLLALPRTALVIGLRPSTWTRLHPRGRNGVGSTKWYAMNDLGDSTASGKLGFTVVVSAGVAG